MGAKGLYGLRIGPRPQPMNTVKLDHKLGFGIAVLLRAVLSLALVALSLQASPSAGVHVG